MKFINKTPVRSHVTISLLALFSLLAGLIVFSPPAVSALSEPAAKEICNIKVAPYKASCLKAVAKCDASNSTCLTNAVRAGNAVYPVCRTADNPQACHTKVKKECGGESGSALQSCMAKVAQGISGANPAAASAPVGGGAGAGGAAPTLAPKGKKTKQCGNGSDAVKTWIDFGCLGASSPQPIGPIEDLAYALVRFLSYGVGLVLAASIIYAGIQYSSSSGNPDQTSAAKKRILNAFIALIFYLLIWAFIQYLVPGGLFKQ